MRIRIVLLVCLAGLLVAQLPAAVTVPKLLSDHMMLQRELPVRIWGKAGPGESVSVRFRDQSVSTTADGQGRWEVFLNPLEAGGPHDMRIEGENTILIRDVLVGEVWVASGQSNMRWMVEQSNDAAAEIAAAKYPRMRLFQVKMETADLPQDDTEGEWALCSPESIPEFSAVGYYFGRRLHKDLNVPVGIIQSTWGGTPAEAWTSQEALRADPALWFYQNRWDRVLAAYPGEKTRHEQAVLRWEEEAAAAKEPPRRPGAPRGPGHHHAPATLYNGMISPLIPYAIRGAIWYQGESNGGADQAHLYRRLFGTMILDWRDRWGQGDFPFLFVQLANFETGPNSDWPVLRESQTRTLQLRNTGMAVTTDIGNPTDIHPRNKQDVGRRLALWALAGTYGKSLVYSGPLYRQLTVEGNRARLWFDHAGGLKADGRTLRGFVVAGDDRIFHEANAKIDGQTVVVTSTSVERPLAVRYGWSDDPENNLRNAEGLPASPFRTDDWPNGQMPE